MEVVLCFGLFFVLDPRQFGGRNIGAVPDTAKAVAALFLRPPGSITNKMLNLDGSRPNAGRHEVAFADRMASSLDRFACLYGLVVTAAREMGITEGQLPDFLGLEGAERLVLLGQEELPPRIVEQAALASAARKRALALTEAETMRLAEHEIRVGQHRFAGAVMANFDHACGFCGFAPRSVGRNGLLVASHIKPWAISEPGERLDPANGIAACPTHDAAFDSGLLTVNGGLRVHLSPRLAASLGSDPRSDTYFGPEVVAPGLLLPKGAIRPGQSYLDWHRTHVFQQGAV